MHCVGEFEPLATNVVYINWFAIKFLIQSILNGLLYYLVVQTMYLIVNLTTCTNFIGEEEVLLPAIRRITWEEYNLDIKCYCTNIFIAFQSSQAPRQV